jgi:Uma2 family endonuclease
MATATWETPRDTLREHVSWQEYEHLLKEYDERPIRLTYDRGNLEIMILSLGHEGYSYLLGRFVDVLTEELAIPVKAGRSTTFKREDLERGLESDNCYWIRNERAMRGKREFDITRDPPPDLALEIDITRSSLDRMGIYAALQVPEVWRFNGSSIRVYKLGKDQRYTLSSQSPTFPFLQMANVLQLLKESETRDETSLIRSFRAWVRKTIVPTWKKTQKLKLRAQKPAKRRKKAGKKQGGNE